MNRILLPAFLLLSLFSSNAFATHAYRSESCTSPTHDLYYDGNYPVGGNYMFSLKGQNQQVVTLPLWDVEDYHNTLEDADVVFDTLNRIDFDRSEITNDGWFDHEEWKSESTIQISLITPEASQKLGLKQGDKITFTCDESTDYPNRTETEEE